MLNGMDLAETLMNRKTRLIIGFCALLLWACSSGGPTRDPIPPARLDGMNELNKGNARYQQGCYRQSLEYFFRAHELFTAADQLGGVAMSMNNIGNVYRAVGDLKSALLFYEEACRLYTGLHDRRGALQSLSNKAAALIDADKLDQAQKEIARAAEINGPERPPFAPLLKNRGLLQLKEGDDARAGQLLNEALKNTDPEDLSEFAAVNFALGSLLQATGRPDEAVRHFEAALSADRSASYYRGIADDLTALGSVCESRGDAQAAAGFFERAVKIYALIQDSAKVDATLDRLAAAARKAGIDPDITNFFVERWKRGEILEKPCR